jgi:hypothetical protein
MKEDFTKPVGDATEEELFDDWFDPIETDVRTTVRGFIETMIEEELTAALWRPRYGGRLTPTEPRTIVTGHRMRTLTGTFGKTEIAVPRARIAVKMVRRGIGQAAGRRLDRERLSFGDQHAPHAPGAQSGLRGGGRKG